MQILSQKKNCKSRIIKFFLIIYIFVIGGCKKLVDVGEPLTTVTTTEVFSTDAQANSTLAAIYSQMMTNTGNLVWSNGAVTIYGGLSSDELINFAGTGNNTDYQFFSNSLLSDNSNINSYFWQPAYQMIYNCNAAIMGMASNKSGLLHDSVKNELTGEAKFLRAFCYFYLTNLFGDVPLILTTDFNQTSLMARSSQNQIYRQIIQDLKDAQSVLPTDYSAGQGERIRANKYAAAALLARVYIFQAQPDWAAAIAETDTVIGSSLFSLDILNGVFQKNSKEAIFQLQQNSNLDNGVRNGTWDGYEFLNQLTYEQLPVGDSITSGTQEYEAIPANFNQDLPYLIGQYYLSPSLVNSFEIGDNRKLQWTDSLPNPNGATYFSPYKYTLWWTTTGGAIPQYYVVLRLAEQYLIRAEAEAQLNQISPAAQDINIIRSRAGLGPITSSTQEDLLKAIYHEREVELFCEWGHRWFDLKRWGNAVGTLTVNKGLPVSTNSLIWPIPQTELTTDPNLIQNPGY